MTEAVLQGDIEEAIIEAWKAVKDGAKRIDYALSENIEVTAYDLKNGIVRIDVLWKGGRQ